MAFIINNLYISAVIQFQLISRGAASEYIAFRDSLLRLYREKELKRTSLDIFGKLSTIASRRYMYTASIGKSSVFLRMKTGLRCFPRRTYSGRSHDTRSSYLGMSIREYREREHFIAGSRESCGLSFFRQYFWEKNRSRSRDRRIKKLSSPRFVRAYGSSIVASEKKKCHR